MTPVEDHIKTLLKFHGMETLLFYMIRHVESGAEGCGMTYQLRLRDDLNTALENYQKRNDPDES